MKPENRAEGELTRTEGSSNKAIELTDDEKAGLSNKKWDKAIKGLTKNKLA